MDNPNETGPSEQKADAPLTPEALAMLGKARRSFGISISILLLGFMAIGFALVYRVMRDAPPPSVAEAVTLPAGASVLAASVNQGAINVTYTLNGRTVLALFDQETGELTRTVAID
ncbi:MAG: DUF6476 family protein [Devosia sp.]